MKKEGGGGNRVEFSKTTKKKNAGFLQKAENATLLMQKVYSSFDIAMNHSG